MPDAVHQDGTEQTTQQVIADLKTEKAALDGQRKEIALLIRQSVAEIDKLTQRAKEASSQLRRVEGDLESFSRSEIRKAYTTSQEAQMRLFMMQSQLEQLRHRQATLDRVEHLLERVAAVARTVTEERQSAAVVETKPAPSGTVSESEAVAAMVQAVESVHYRVSRRLQDETAQALSDLILRSEVCERLAGADPKKAREEMARLKQVASGALKSARRLVQDLYAPALEEAGFLQALKRYLEGFRSGETLQVDLAVAGVERPIPRAGGVALYRIVQEALANTAVHAGTSRAQVGVRYGQGEVIVTVADQGRGFDVKTAVAQARSRERSGLTDMRMRAGLVGATFEVASKPGEGCVVTISLPA